jgi:adenine-specific DNA methylase
MDTLGYEKEWQEALWAYLATVLDKCADYGSSLARWESGGEFVVPTFQRFALSVLWDYAETNPLIAVSGSYQNQLGWVLRYVEHALAAVSQSAGLEIRQQSATNSLDVAVDVVVTDPPYYSAIPYADLADFFYVWLRRTVGELYPGHFTQPIIEKEGEIALRKPHADIPEEHTQEWFEDQMAIAFGRAWEVLSADGRMVIVFAHKEPDAWETLTTAMIRTGFTVSASWPIDTERSHRPRAHGSAALASSIWLVCRKRPENAGIGRYRAVRKAMEERVTERLRYFWDIGLSGPDFVWAAVGPALESYSSYSEVKRMDGSTFTVGEFLKEVRRMVADFALGQILKGQSTEGLDEWTRYYLIHRSNFGLADAPVGECILLTQGYGLDLNDLRSERGYIRKGSGSDVRLAKWDERTRDDLGRPHPSGGLPMIDALHHLMQLWAAGALDRLNQYVAEQGLRQHELFWAVAQAILEMAEAKSRERTLLEAIVAWGRGKAPSAEGATQPALLEDVN